VTGPKFDHLIYIGAGECRELPKYLECARKITLVEANPITAVILRERTKNYTGVEVLEQVISNDTRIAKFHHHNYGDADGLRVPTEYTNWFAGVHRTETKSVETMEASRFVHSIGGPSNCSKILILDINGEEMDVLVNLSSSGLLSTFQEVIVFTALEPMFEDAEIATNIFNNLQEYGFTNVEIAGVGQFRQVIAKGFQTSLFSRSRESSITELRDIVNAQSKEITAFQIERLEHATYNKKQSYALRSAKGIITKLKSRVATIEVANRALNDQLVSQQLAAEKVLRETEFHWGAKIHKLKDSNKNALDREQDKYESLNSELSRSLRQQMSAQMDLENLQVKYLKLKTFKEMQDDILYSLNTRLTEASELLKLLSTPQENPRNRTVEPENNVASGERPSK
jgi:FkbM family methyltransferase